MPLALNEAAQAALLASMSILPRLVSARHNGTTVGLTVVAVYASKLDATEKAKDASERVPAGDMLIVAGEWNAIPGPVNTATRHILGN